MKFSEEIMSLFSLFHFFWTRILPCCTNPPSATSFLLWIVGGNLDLHPHVIFSQSRNPNTSPNGLMIRHPLLEVPHHRGQSLVVDRHVIRIHAENLRPSLAPRILQVHVDIGKSLVNLSVYLGIEDTRVGVPSACVFQWATMNWYYISSRGPAYLGQHIQSCLQLERLDCNGTGRAWTRPALCTRKTGGATWFQF